MVNAFFTNKTQLTLTLMAVVNCATLSPTMASSIRAYQGEETGAAAAAGTRSYKDNMDVAYKATIMKLIAAAKAGETSPWNTAILQEDSNSLVRLMALFETPMTDMSIDFGGTLRPDFHNVISTIKEELTPFIEDENSAKVLIDLMEYFTTIAQNIKTDGDFGMLKATAANLFEEISTLTPDKFTELLSPLIEEEIFIGIEPYDIIRAIRVSQYITPDRLIHVLKRTKTFRDQLDESDKIELGGFLNDTQLIHGADWENFIEYYNSSSENVCFTKETLLEFCLNDASAWLPPGAIGDELPDTTLANISHDRGTYLCYTTYIPNSCWADFINYLIENDAAPEAEKTAPEILTLIDEHYHQWRGSEGSLIKAARKGGSPPQTKSSTTDAAEKSTDDKADSADGKSEV